ncbi:DUF885 domain-containing protein [Streptomyces buecherae]|uniref:DUF885 domain-containing protein n=1 Tax=Streptomyces buecherae TaxID=2763006 RepID=UPI0033ECB32F
MLDRAPNRALPRHVADTYADALVELDPILGTYLGMQESHGHLPDFSPEGLNAQAALIRSTLRRLDQAQAQPGAEHADERRCARLLKERLSAELAVLDAGEGLRAISNINLNSPVHAMRDIFSLTPTASDEDWEAVLQRLRAVPDALAGYRRSLERGMEQQLVAGPRQVGAAIVQLNDWVGGTRPGLGWFADFAGAGPTVLQPELSSAAKGADAAVDELRVWLSEVYAPAAASVPDAVGRERYSVWARYWTGSNLDLDETYEYGWSEFHRLLGEMRMEAERILPGAATPWEALDHLKEHGTVIEGLDTVRDWLQSLMDEAITKLDGTYFELAEPVRRVQSMIAPAGGAAAPYYTEPSMDFSRPGRTWLPTMGATRFPIFDLVSTWYHEGVPGHHLQLAQWTYLGSQLSRYQTMVGMVGANTEGWALYAERLMDELGFLGDAERRLGYLDAQMMRSIRVIIDIGMHLGLPIPASSPFRPGERWTPVLAQGFFAKHSGRPFGFVQSEMVRYLGAPGQAIGYKLGERAWLRGREAARRNRGNTFNLKNWHMAALSLGSLGLDDLEAELSSL